MRWEWANPDKPRPDGLSEADWLMERAFLSRVRAACDLVPELETARLVGATPLAGAVEITLGRLPNEHALGDSYVFLLDARCVAILPGQATRVLIRKHAGADADAAWRDLFARLLAVFDAANSGWINADGEKVAH